MTLKEWIKEHEHHPWMSKYLINAIKQLSTVPYTKGLSNSVPFNLFVWSRTPENRDYWGIMYDNYSTGLIPYTEKDVIDILHEYYPPNDFPEYYL